MAETAQRFTAYCRANGRVCPQPQGWLALWEMLPNRRRVGLGSEPPLPLIFAAWYDTPAMLKMALLAEHIQWADRHDYMEPV